MRYIKFTMETDHDNTGEIGIMPNIHRNWNGYIPSQPDGLAHDLLEHSVNETGAFDEELGALGGFLFVRAFGAYRSSTFTPLNQALAWDITSAFRDDSTLRDAPKWHLTKAENEKIQTLLDSMRPLVIDSYESEFYDEYDDENYDCMFENDAEWKRVCDWIKYGFMRAKRRFKGDDGLAFAVYERISRAIKPHWQTLLEFADSGREFTLKIDYENGWADLELGETY